MVSARATDDVSPTPRRVWTELAILLAIASAAIVFVTWYMRGQALDSIGVDRFWMHFSLGVALGHGAQAPAGAAIFDDFLDRKFERISVADIPANVTWEAINPFAETHLYLIYLCGWMWRLFGISWEALAPLFGLFYAAGCVAVYGIFRLGAGRLLSFAGVLLFAVTPIHLAILPQLRDYSKAPFILGLLFVLGLAVRRTSPWPLRNACGLGAAAGLLIGVGLGLRQDIQICLLPAAVVFACFMPGALRTTWKARAAALLVMGLLTAIASFPVLDAMRRGGGNPAHNILGGFSETCTHGTGYSGHGAALQPLFSDPYISLTVRAHQRYEMDASTPIAYLSPEYNIAGKDLVLQYANFFPYNLLLRAAAMFRTAIMILPLEHGIPGFPETPLMRGVLDHGFWWWYEATRMAPFALALVVLFSLGHSLRAGMCLAFLLAFFCTYPVLQYHPRHAFHLSFVVWWVIFVLAQYLLHMVVACRTTEGRKELRARTRWTALRAPVLRAAAGAGAMLLCVTTALGAAYVMQQRTGAQYVDTLRALPRQPLQVVQGPSTVEGLPAVLIAPRGLFPAEPSEEDARWQFSRRILAAEFVGASREVPVSLVYDYAEHWGNYRLDTQISLGDGERHVWFYFPVYSEPAIDAQGKTIGTNQFKGIDIPERYLDSFRGMYVLSKDAPLALYAQLDDAVPAGEVTLARMRGYVPKGPLRMTLAAARNLLVNAWAVGDEAPAGCQSPQAGSTITRDLENVLHGDFAVKQVWPGPDLQPNPLLLYGVRLPMAKAGQQYDVCVDAKNVGDAAIALTAWLIQTPEIGAPMAALLNPVLIRVPPNSGYATYFGGITMPRDLPPDTSLLLTPTAPEGVKAGQTVYWDTWRFAESPSL